MGWTGIFDAITKDNGSIDRRATLENIFGSWSNGDKSTKMLKSGMKGATFYAAMETTTPEKREVWALVVLTSVSGREFCYKSMDETEHPYYFDCPAAILNMLTPTENESANAWREECRKQAAEKRKKGATIPRSATEIYITFKRDNNAAKAGEAGTVYRRFDKWVYTDARGQSWRITAAMLHNPDFLTVNGTNADKPREEYEQTKIEFTEEAPADQANEETPAETVKKPTERRQKAAKLCYNVVIYTTAQGIRRADIRTASGRPYMDIPAAELDAIREEIARKDPTRVQFNINDTTTTPTTTPGDGTPKATKEARTAYRRARLKGHATTKAATTSAEIKSRARNRVKAARTSQKTAGNNYTTHHGNDP